MGLFDFLNEWEQKASQRREVQKQNAELQRKVAAYEFEKPQLERINNESVEIIDRTKDLKVAMGRFDTMRNNYGRLFTLNPHDSPVSMSIGRWLPICEASTYEQIMNHTEKAKKLYTQQFYLTKIRAELLKAEHLTDSKLKKAQLRKALKVALDSTVKLPKDPAIQDLLKQIETQLSNT